MTSNELITLTTIKNYTNKWITGANLIAEIHQNTMGQCNLSGVELRAIIQKLRLYGNPIIAGTKGYMLTTSIKDIKEYCSYRRTEIQLELKVLGVLEEVAEEMLKKVGKTMVEITTQEWEQFLTEQHINPDNWCDYNPEDYGFKLKD